MGVELRARRRRSSSASARMFEPAAGAMPDEQPAPGRRARRRRRSSSSAGAPRPGSICPVGDDKVIYAVPGRAVRDAGDARAGDPARPAAPGRRAPSVIVSRTLRTWGESESGLAERLADRIDELDARGQPARIAFLASGIEGLKVRITAKGADEAAGRELLDDRGGASCGRCSATSCSASTTRRWRSPSARCSTRRA